MRWSESPKFPGQSPSTNIQHPEKFQTLNTNFRAQVWSLVIGVSLDVGAWNLEL
jgi:hypothetical protein